MDDYFEPRTPEQRAAWEKRLDSLEDYDQWRAFWARIKQLTPEEQWEKCERWREHLRRAKEVKTDLSDTLSALAESWSKLPHNVECSVTSFRIDMKLKTPLETLFEYVGAGHYPPPELLMALWDTWQHYLAGDGRDSLEKAFMGPPVPKAGNGAKRSNTQDDEITNTSMMGALLDSGLTRMKAAEALARHTGKEADTIVREIKPFRLPKPEK